MVLESEGGGTQAALKARRAMGPSTLMREDARAVWIVPWMQSVARDVAYAFRCFRRQPGFTIVAVIALAFAIGLNTSLFTVFNALALRPWAVPEANRVVTAFRHVKNPPKGFDGIEDFSLGEFRYLTQASKTMSGLFLTRGESRLHLDAGTVRAEYVTAGIFDVLGLRMARGRGFAADEDRAEAPRAVAVLAFDTWQSRFGGDPEILSRRILLDGIPFTVVGVTPREFTGVNPERTDLWIPVASVALLHPSDVWARQFASDPETCCLAAAGRLAPGVTREQAQAELSVLSAAYTAASRNDSDGVVLAGTPALQRPGQKARQIYAIFGLVFAAVTLVLLLACANVGNLLLARALARRKEIGVRLSMGAGRARLIRQLLTESMALAGLAGVIGIGIAYKVPAPLFHAVVGDAGLALMPDGSVLIYSLALTVLACLAFGLAPALHATRGNVADTMRERQPGAGTRLALRSTLLATQVAISVILLVSAGLMTRGILLAYHRDAGFAVDGNAAVTFDFPTSAYGNLQMATFFHNIADGLEHYAGAKPYGIAAVEPLSNSRRFTGFHLPWQDAHATNVIAANNVSPGYFEVLRIPIVEGRNLDVGDEQRPSVVVNQAMARRYFPDGSAVGKTIIMDKQYQIVGVARDAYLVTMDSVQPMLFLPLRYNQPAQLIVRQNPANLTAIETLAQRLDPRLHMQVTPLSAAVDRALNTSRMGAWIAAGLGFLALVLAGIGVAGVFAYAVQQRTQEIGIRVALGASPSQVTKVVLSWAARSLGIGTAIGLAGSMAAARVLHQYLFGLNGLDPVTFAGVLGILLFAGMLAAWLPARRAMKLDPVRALRCD